MVKRKTPRQRARITEEQVHEMMRLQRQGQSIQSIARAMGCHRQTVRMHLKEKEGDILRDEARKQMMIEAIREHFKELADFAGKDLRQKFEASPAEGSTVRSRRFFPGILGVPGNGSALYMASEWERIYDPTSRERHLTGALREHCGDSPFWEHWVRWQNEIGLYRQTGDDFRHWLVSKTEERIEFVVAVGTDSLELIQKWLFGNVLRLAAGEPCEKLRIVKRKDHEEWVSDGTVVARMKDGEVIYDCLQSILEEARRLNLLAELQKTMKDLEERQPELRKLTGEIDFALEALQMMHGFPGRCHLCPV